MSIREKFELFLEMSSLECCPENWFLVTRGILFVEPFTIFFMVETVSGQVVFSFRFFRHVLILWLFVIIGFPRL